MLPEQFNFQIKNTARIFSSPYRTLPDFIIIGAQKFGTASLFIYMTQHQQILASSTKEVHHIIYSILVV